MALRDPEQAKLLKHKADVPKYHNKRVRYGGHTFDSLAELGRYIFLLKLHEAKAITRPELHPSFRFKCGHKYVADFAYWDNTRRPPLRVIEDVKGVRTRMYARNVVMLRHEWGLEVTEITPTAQDYVLAHAALGEEAGRNDRANNHVRG